MLTYARASGSSGESHSHVPSEPHTHFSEHAAPLNRGRSVADADYGVQEKHLKVDEIGANLVERTSSVSDFNGVHFSAAACALRLRR